MSMKPHEKEAIVAFIVATANIIRDAVKGDDVKEAAEQLIDRAEAIGLMMGE